ncbi:uncharacterized protein LOC110233135 isoform X2 [Exaiptasia diaphana]|uniref:Uncharacterized protein n=1 Tax=Exaiptasia diaphana TaxID=2652724 RepID=A0A913YF36_EXADI|nr:uncharacterized protein LOC110233135 isoform X2 [Exaiptasia diaphana]
MKKSTGRPAQVVLNRQQKTLNNKQVTVKSRKEQGKSNVNPKKLTKLKSKVNLGRTNNVQLGKDNLAMSDVSTDSENSSDEGLQEREKVLTIDCGNSGVLGDIGFELMGGRTYDDDDYDDPGIYVQDVTEGHDVARIIEAGDQVIRIAGHSVLDVPLHHALNLIRAANSRVVINILKHPENKLGPELPQDSDDDSGPATSIQGDDFEEINENESDELDGRVTPNVDMGLGGGLFLASLAVANLEFQQGSRQGSMSALGSVKPGSKAGSIAGSSRVNSLSAGASRIGSTVGSLAGSKLDLKQGSIVGSKNSTLTRGVNASSSAVDETDGGEEVEVGFFSGRPGQLDDLDFDYAGGRDAPFVSRNGGIFITKVKFGSVLEEQVAPGDKIIKLDGIDVTNVPQYAFINLIRASHGKATMIVRKANKTQVNASVFQDDLEVCVNALGAQDELIIEIKTGPKGRRGQIGFKITGGRDKPCKPGDPGVFIKSVKPGSKLEKILKPGDKLLKVDGKNVTQATQGQVLDLIRNADIRVLLHIKRPVFEEDEERRKQRTISEIFDAAQVQEFLAAFELYSSPLTKKMRLSDLRKLCRALGFNLTSQDIEAMITKYKHENVDAAHFITFPEFLKMITEFSMYLQKDADIMEAFEIFDRERSGFFLLEDLKYAFQCMPGYSSLDDEEIQEIMKIADSNGDGKVYYQDFKDLVLPIFHKY